MATDTKVSELIFNKLTKAQYDSATKNPNELYIVKDAKITKDDLDDSVLENYAELPTVSSIYPSDNIPEDNTIYNLGEKNEITVAALRAGVFASISVTAGAGGLALGIASGVKVIGDVPSTIDAGTELFIGIIDGKMYVNEVKA